MKNPIIPAGSIILTPDEVARLRDLIKYADDAHPGPSRRNALLSVGLEIKDILDDSKPLEGEN